MSQLKTIFILGKGGTGKSTASTLLSLELAERGRKSILASFDDAHNLTDIFEQPFSHKASRVKPFLDVIQMDRDREIKRYLEQTTEKVKKNYTYLTAFNLDNYFDVLKFSPGMEAHALTTAFVDLKTRYSDRDFLIIDMPPTALSMHFFNLPSLSLTWIEQLEKLRMDINERKEIISRIRFAGKERERDKVLARIHEIKAGHAGLKAFFKDASQARFWVVHNPDALSLAETGRIIDQLSPLNIRLSASICSHRSSADIPGNHALPGWAELPSAHLPFSPSPLIGPAALEKYRAEHRITLMPLID